MKKNPFEIKITVIVPIYNVEQYLRRCVDSIINQTHKNLEIILVDDGSTDNSGLVADNYKTIDSRIVVIHKINGGLGSARNAGLDIATGDYIAFVDSDDWIDKDMYEIMLRECIRKDSDICICGRKNIDFNGKSKIGLCPRKRETIKTSELLGRILVWDNMDFACWDKIYKSKLWIKHRFPIYVINEDIAIMHKVIKDANKACIVNLPLYNYFHRKESITTSSFSTRKFDFEKISKLVCASIKQNFPELNNNIIIFRLSAVSYTINIISNQKFSILLKYYCYYRSFKNEVKKYYKYWKNIEYFPNKIKCNFSDYINESLINIMIRKIKFKFKKHDC